MQYKTGDVVLLKVHINRVDETDPRLPYQADPEKGTGFWFGDGDVLAICTPQTTPAEPQPKPFQVGDWVTIHNRPDVGQIEENDGSDWWPWLVRFMDGSSEWQFERDLTHVDKPEGFPDYIEPKFKVGDRVIHTQYPEKGAGVIKRDDKSRIPYLIRYPNGNYEWAKLEHTQAAPEPEPEPKFKVGDKVIHIHKPEWGVGTIKNLNPCGTDIDYTDRTENTPEVHSTQFYQVEYPHKYIDAGWPCSGFWATAEENLTPA